eukprot:CAMPEP_0185317232 /NCGR_PEP_ID=MMETSP1363-20130426/46268_1 /TAXON_ID=38817 /ORGANISM="Gephyrocapsa oceanica, Strain RCC1303" /LENGTH=57 /DNA_ID=CAMNT_0027915479 /DNA_START=66 /DNA_END=236 /DNA_ORIENTATION=+
MLIAYVTLSTNIVPVSPSSANELAAVAPMTCANVKTVLSRNVVHSARRLAAQHALRP